MKKKNIKEIIKECVKEVIKEMGEYKLTASERNKINNDFHKKGELGGTIKLDQKGKALNIINQILNQHGFELDLVTGDIIMGDSGNRLLTFRKKDTSGDPFMEGPEVSNSKISFTWENMIGSLPTEKYKSPRWEIIAYVT